MPTIIFGHCLFVPFGTYLLHRNINPKLIIFGTSLISGILLLVASATDDFGTFFFLWAFAQSFNSGFAYMVPVHHSWLWFPKHPGLTSGIVIGGFGFGSVVWNNLSTRMINPHDLPVDEETF